MSLYVFMKSKYGRLMYEMELLPYRKYHQITPYHVRTTLKTTYNLNVQSEKENI